VLDPLLRDDFPGVGESSRADRDECCGRSLRVWVPNHRAGAASVSQLRTSGTAGPTPVEGQVAGDPPLQLILLLDDTRQLSYLELVWFGMAHRIASQLQTRSSFSIVAGTRRTGMVFVVRFRIGISGGR